MVQKIHHASFWYLEDDRLLESKSLAIARLSPSQMYMEGNEGWEKREKEEKKIRVGGKVDIIIYMGIVVDTNIASNHVFQIKLKNI